MKKTGVLINPNAKKFRTGRSSLKKYTSINSDLIAIRTTESSDEIKDVIYDFKKSNCDYIGIAGGDGKLHLAVSELINIYGPGRVPPILILREGTMDNVARTIKLKGRGPELIRRLLWAVENNRRIEIHRRNTLKINNKYCFLFGTGIVTNFLNQAYSGKEKGLIRNIQVAFAAFIESIRNEPEGIIFNTMSGEIFIDDNILNINPVNGILAGTVEHIGMGFSPLAEAGSLDNAFQAIITGMPPLNLIKNLNRIRIGSKINDSGYYNNHCRSMKLIYPEDFDYTMDGDIYRAEKELIVEMGPVIDLIKV